MINSKKWIISFIIISSFMFIAIGSFVIIIDPYFHFHSPIDGLQYPINNERYQSDGIVRNFEYDAIITGTSITENFKTSECDEIFGVTSIKVPFSGSTFKEVNDNLLRAFEANPDIKLVIRSIDAGIIKADKDLLRYDSYPTYLTDNNTINDINYVLNKKSLLSAFHVLLHTQKGNTTTSFDTYANWMNKRKFGKGAAISNYTRPKKTSKINKFDDTLRERTLGNMTQNVTEIARQNPDVEFYCFFPPFSILYWDASNQNGNLQLYIDMYKYATELMLEYDNIHVFSFFEEYDMITNIDNYSDSSHYHEDINSQILIWMGNGEHELTKENYEEHWNKVQEFYSNYDYDAIFSK